MVADGTPMASTSSRGKAVWSSNRESEGRREEREREREY